MGSRSHICRYGFMGTYANDIRINAEGTACEYVLLMWLASMVRSSALYYYNKPVIGNPLNVRP